MSIDKTAILGYKSGRAPGAAPLKMGDRAVVRSNTVIYDGTVIGENIETGHNVVIREENIIGDRLRIWNNSCIDYGCTIGNDVKIHNNVYIAQFTTIEDNVFIAPCVSITNDPHPECARCMKGPTIKKGAKIGGNVTILPKVIIGENALIGAGSVVTRDIPPNSVAVGNPARVIKKIDDLMCEVEPGKHVTEVWAEKE